MVHGKWKIVNLLHANHALLQITLVATRYLSDRYGTWGLCFTYGTLFAVKGLVAAGRTYNSSASIRKACNFLLSKQQISGGWGESYLSSETEVKFLSYDLIDQDVPFGFEKVIRFILFIHRTIVNI